jgi:ABC-type hemin transport system ATPase subunit
LPPATKLTGYRDLWRHALDVCAIFSDCNEVAKHLEQVLDMQIGRLELSSKAEDTYDMMKQTTFLFT